MSMERHYRSVLKALSPRDVAGWLRMHGFSSVRKFGEYGLVFARKRQTQELEVILPTSPDVRDFTRRMREMIEDLSVAEDRSEEEILTDLTLAPFDVIKIRSPDADDYGSVPLSVGLELHGEARNLVLSAANAAASPTPRRSFRGRRFEEVTEYLSAVRLGQSQRGSFVLTVLSRYDFVPERQPGLDLGTDPFGRRVTKALASAIDATDGALRASIAGGVDPLTQAYRAGVSSNFCQALSKLAREGEGVDISVDWSPVHPEPKRSLIRLKREDAPVLSEAAKALAQQEDEPNVQIVGLISLIKEPPESFNGLVVLESLMDGRLSRVNIDFGYEDRSTVYEAAEQKKWVSVEGDLRRQGNRLTLLKPRALQIVDPSDVEPLTIFS